ncbi:MAG: type II toxin-antitoxin system PemK/MazF family toxin [Coriobacteriaceae bacterium]|nr:type II toxin-antitoxin system PemK/MazF family toxin [Coriobacteriaceae bacterium]
MKGDVWLAQSDEDRYLKKLRPVVVIQDERSDVFESIVVVLGTTFEDCKSPVRVKIEPSSENGLQRTSLIMVDKISSIHKSHLQYCLGRLSDTDIRRIDLAVLALLGICRETAFDEHKMTNLLPREQTDSELDDLELS